VPFADGIALDAVAAVSATDVWAFGLYRLGKPLAEHWDGSSWQQVPIPAPKGAAEIEIGRAVARTATDIWVVGSWAGPNTSFYRTLVEHWNGTAWKIVRSPSARAGSRLIGVTVVSAKDAWAVGESLVTNRVRNFSFFETLILHWDGKAWKRVPSPNPAEVGRRRESQDSSLADVTAVSARNAWAVGTYFRRARNGHHSDQTLVLHWNGKGWRQVVSPNPGGIRHVNELDAVAAKSASDVWSVGGYRNGRGEELLLAEHWNGHAWKAVPAPGPISAEQRLTSLAPLSAGDVWASGSYLDDDGLIEQPLLGHWNGSAWTLLPTPKHRTNVSLNEIAAVSPNDVWAVGWVASP
jgi:hypothetical protein